MAQAERSPLLRTMSCITPDVGSFTIPAWVPLKDNSMIHDVSIVGSGMHSMPCGGNEREHTST